MKINKKVVSVILGVAIALSGGAYGATEYMDLKEENTKLEQKLEKQAEKAQDNAEKDKKVITEQEKSIKEKDSSIKEKDTKINNLEQKLQEEKEKLDKKDKELKDALAAKAERARQASLKAQQAQTTTQAKSNSKQQQQVTVSRSSEPSNVQREFYVEATAYTPWCAGCSGITATGINVAANPNMKLIAVDPRVIPLGSKVWVEGYGYAIAGDTGGAIKGNKIDLLMPSKEQAYAWGRKTVRIKVLGK